MTDGHSPSQHQTLRLARPVLTLVSSFWKPACKLWGWSSVLHLWLSIVDSGSVWDLLAAVTKLNAVLSHVAGGLWGAHRLCGWKR